MHAAQYQHLVLGLIFLNYILYAFDERQKILQKQNQRSGSTCYL